MYVCRLELPDTLTFSVSSCEAPASSDPHLRSRLHIPSSLFQPLLTFRHPFCNTSENLTLPSSPWRLNGSVSQLSLRLSYPDKLPALPRSDEGFDSRFFRLPDIIFFFDNGKVFLSAHCVRNLINIVRKITHHTDSGNII